MNARSYEGSKLRLFIRFYRPHKRLFLLDMVTALAIAGIDLVYPLAMRVALNEFLPEREYSFFFLLILGLVGMYVVRSVLSYIFIYWGHRLGIHIEADMRRVLFGHMQKLGFTFYDHNSTGRLMSRVTTDLFEITELAHHGPEDLLISFTILIGSILILWGINWQLALFLLILIPITLLYTISQQRRMRKTSRAVKEKMAGINADIEAAISGAKTCKAFANEAYEVTKFARGNDRYCSVKGAYYKSMATFHSGMELFINFFAVAVIGVGGFFILQDYMDPVDVLTFSLYVGIFLQPIRRLTQFMERYNTGMAGFQRFLEVLRIKPEMEDVSDAVEIGRAKGDISFKDVTFAYNNADDPVLAHLDLEIWAGETLAVVGPSGGGKTTLCHLIPRFYAPQSGTITLDGTDLRQISLESLRKNIGIVSQDVFLFSGTVRENIRYGRIDATDEEVMEAARRAEIYDDIMELPYGFDTQVGEHGMAFSGGQKQRISIARIFLKNPPILILDEATSALDSLTEQKVQRSFDELCRGRTTLVIAHRLATLQNADEIVFIDEHGIRERGTHTELLALGGAYAALCGTGYQHV
ncbi:MAG: ABC transporter ATP-binding protein/permease [Oscillospiraceae bacterium]|nr:ABC transporter ATP-binding protein/permease [Oscillospiraceae bacterium]